VNAEPLRSEIEDDPRSFGFFQAVRLLEALQPERTAVGEDANPEDEAVRFSVHPSIGFPPSEIEDVAFPEEGPPVMTVNFFGVVGPQGTLPLDYTTLVEERVLSRDTTLRDFLDLFHHRVISLFYKAWLKHRFLVQRERGDEDVVSTHLLDLLGFGLPAQRGIPDLDPLSVAGYAAFLSAQPRSAQGLRQVLEDYFQVPAAVEQFVGNWYRLRTQDQCEGGDETRMSSVLGMGALPGDEVWDSQGGVRIRLGPLDRAAYESFLPDGEAYDALVTLLRYFSHDEHTFEVQLVLDEAEVPGLHLGADEARQLGWTTWLRTRQAPKPADETILYIDERDSP